MHTWDLTLVIILIRDRNTIGRNHSLVAIQGKIKLTPQNIPVHQICYPLHFRAVRVGIA